MEGGMKLAVASVLVCACASRSVDERTACNPELIQPLHMLRLSGSGAIDGDYEVDRLGFIDVPSFGRTEVRGQHPEVVAETLTEKVNDALPTYAIEARPRAAIKVELVSPGRTIRISGGGPPRTLEYKPGMRALQVLEDHGYSVELPVVYQWPCMSMERVDPSLPVQAGDVIYIGPPLKVTMYE
jgi:hypothetical protein